MTSSGEASKQPSREKVTVAFLSDCKLADEIVHYTADVLFRFAPTVTYADITTGDTIVSLPYSGSIDFRLSLRHLRRAGKTVTNPWLVGWHINLRMDKCPGEVMKNARLTGWLNGNVNADERQLVASGVRCSSDLPIGDIRDCLLLPSKGVPKPAIFAGGFDLLVRLEFERPVPGLRVRGLVEDASVTHRFAGMVVGSAEPPPDVTIAANDGTEFAVHSEVLRFRSPYFGGMLDAGQSFAKLQLNYDPAVVRVLLDHMYNPTDSAAFAQLAEQHVRQVLTGAHKLGLNRLKQMAELSLMKSTDHGNILDLLALAHENGAVQLEAFGVDYLVKVCCCAKTDAKYLELTQRCPALALQLLQTAMDFKP